MTHPDYDALLRRHDDPSAWEAPAGFDREAAEARFRALLPALEKALGAPIEFEDGPYIQDASFHAQLFLPRGALRRELSDVERGVVRFSNFGSMVTVSRDDAVEPAVLARLRDVVTAAGYSYVPESALDRPYTGRNPGVTGIATWWIRYFDWI